MGDHRAPSATDVEMTVARLHLRVLANGVELTFLSALQGLVRVLKDAARVGHAFAEEPIVEIVSAVVDVGNVILVRHFGVRNVLPQELAEIERNVAPGKTEAKELVALEQRLVDVLLEVEALGHVGLVQDLHRDLFALPLRRIVSVFPSDKGLQVRSAAVVPVRADHEPKDRNDHAEKRHREPRQQKRPPAAACREHRDRRNRGRHGQEQESVLLQYPENYREDVRSPALVMLRGAARGARRVAT